MFCNQSYFKLTKYIYILILLKFVCLAQYNQLIIYIFIVYQTISVWQTNNKILFIKINNLLNRLTGILVKILR